MTLLETYAKRLEVADKIHQQKFNESMSETKKIVLATTLNNTTKFLNEKFANSVGTQRTALGDYKKFCINLTNVALPTLIGPDLVITYPMTSFTGYLAYVKYTAGSNKGATKQGDVFNDPFRLGKVDPSYTSQAVVEGFIGDGSTTEFTVAWTPLASVKSVTVAGEAVEFTVDGDKVVLASAPASQAQIKIAYLYDNVIIPQNDIPTLNAEWAGITLTAKARRIAIYYSSIAAYQAKTDYGFDMGKQLAEKAKGQFAYEIDTEICQLLIDNAEVDSKLAFNKRVPFGISKAQHFEGFAEKIEIAKAIIYKKTKRYTPDYMLIDPFILPILTFMNGYKAKESGKHNGPYLAGNLNGLNVYVTPTLTETGKYVLGVNGDGLETSAAVFAPYMAIVPTQLLEFADGGNSQGFSTLYDLQILNDELLIAGTVVDEDYTVKTEEVVGA